MTFLHVFAWTGVIFVALFVVVLVALVPLGLRERQKARAEARREAGRWAPILPRQPRPPHTPRSETKHLREPESEQDPDPDL